MTGPSGRGRPASRPTPRRYRLWSIVIGLLLVAVALGGGVAAANLRGATDRIRANTGPVLVATQTLVASLAEADAAAVAAFLSGAQEDPEQRRLYEEALARANEQIERISSLVGDDPGTHRTLSDIAVQVTRYAGLVEAARASNRAGIPGAERYLVDAVTLLAVGISRDAGRLTATTQERLDRDEDDRSRGFVPAVALAVAGAVALVVAQVYLARRTRRLVNLPLLGAWVLVVAVAGALAVASRRSEADLDAARRSGYESIALTARIQTVGFGSRADETLALITGDAARRATADRAAAQLLSAPVTDPIAEAVRSGDPVGAEGLLARAAAEADSPRERAAVAEMLVRWQRYRDNVARLRAAPAAGEARAVAVGPASSTFNGFNFSVESVLSDNRAQFLSGLDAAAGRVRVLPLVTLLVPLVAGAAVLLGFQLRINEYR